MNDVIGAPAPVWLRIVAALGLCWNLFGVYAYLQTVGALSGGDASMSDAAMPAWVTGAFAIAVFGGALGCLGSAPVEALVEAASASLLHRPRGAGRLGVRAP